MYSAYLEDTRTVKMASILKEKAPALSEDERLKVAKFLLDKKILTKDVIVRVYDTATDFAEEITLDDYRLDHSWAGDRIYKDDGTWLIGDGQFGKKTWRQYSDNGNCSIPKESLQDPEFDMGKVQVVYKKRYHLNSFRSPTEEWTRHELLIFLT